MRSITDDENQSMLTNFNNSQCIIQVPQSHIHHTQVPGVSTKLTVWFQLIKFFIDFINNLKIESLLQRYSQRHITRHLTKMLNRPWWGIMICKLPLLAILNKILKTRRLQIHISRSHDRLVHSILTYKVIKYIYYSFTLSTAYVWMESPMGTSLLSSGLGRELMDKNQLGGFRLVTLRSCHRCRRGSCPDRWEWRIDPDSRRSGRLSWMIL